jgi:hypothetical protein
VTMSGEEGPGTALLLLICHRLSLT